MIDSIVVVRGVAGLEEATADVAEALERGEGLQKR